VQETVGMQDNSPSQKRGSVKNPSQIQDQQDAVILKAPHYHAFREKSLD